MDMSENSHLHFRVMASLYSSLRALSGQGNAPYVAVQTPLYYDEEHKNLAKQPDLMVVTGVKEQDRARYNLWEEGQVPTVVFEITSGESWTEDLVNKSALYMRLGVKEYFIFDPHGEFLQTYVLGLRLVEKDGRQEYLPIKPNKDGMVTSHELNARLLIKDHLLRLVPGKQLSGEQTSHEDTSDDQRNPLAPIPWADELFGLQIHSDGQATIHLNGADNGALDELKQVQAQLQTAEARLKQAEERVHQVEEQAQHKGQDAQRLKTLEAENAHLRVLLGQMQGTKVAR